jgi:acetyl esterase
MSASYAQFPPFDQISHAEARAVAEQVRRPWRQGGPAMAEVNDIQAPTGEGPVRVRVFRPEGVKAGAPVLVYLHGGGWTFFSLDTHDRVMREYAARSGFVVAGVDYALSPEAKFPTALHQVVGVVQWLRGEGARCLGTDSQRIAVGGDSAGGNLSVGAALKLRDLGEAEAVKALLLNYAVVDRVCSEEAGRLWGGEGFMLAREEMDVFWANYLRSPEEAETPLACPMRAEVAGLPPVRLTIAECDVLAEQNHAFANRLAAAGVDVSTAVYRGATHSFLEAASVSWLAERALQDGAEWLMSHLADA